MPVEGAQLSAWFPWIAVRTTLDDDVTPGAVRFLLALWERTGDARYRTAGERGIELLLRAQLPAGGWPHVWRPSWLRAVRASREDHASLNDGLTPIIVETLLAASVTLRRPELVESAGRGGDWLLAVQQPPPRAGWAQQYDEAEHPAGRPSPAPLPGDPGACPGASDPLHEGHGARSLIAQAGMQLAGLSPAPIAACAVVPLEVVDSTGLR
jgi:hypothetical protein